MHLTWHKRSRYLSLNVLHVIHMTSPWNIAWKILSNEFIVLLDYSYSRINNDVVTSHCTYQFTCDCVSIYIGRTEWILKTRVGKHIPKWLENHIKPPYPIDGNGRYWASSIAKHFIELGLKLNVNNSFKVIYKHKRGDTSIHWGTGNSEIESPFCSRSVHFLIRTPLILISLGIEFCSYALWSLWLQCQKFWNLDW